MALGPAAGTWLGPRLGDPLCPQLQRHSQCLEGHGPVWALILVSASGVPSHILRVPRQVSPHTSWCLQPGLLTRPGVSIRCPVSFTHSLLPWLFAGQPHSWDVADQKAGMVSHGVGLSVCVWAPTRAGGFVPHGCWDALVTTGRG